MKIKVLDASGPPGLPNLLAAGSEMMLVTAISALSFSPDGEVHFINWQNNAMSPDCQPRLHIRTWFHLIEKKKKERSKCFYNPLNFKFFCQTVSKMLLAIWKCFWPFQKLCQTGLKSSQKLLLMLMYCIGGNHLKPFGISIHKEWTCSSVLSTIITYPIAGAGCFLWAWIDDQMVVTRICILGETESKLSSCPVHKIDLCSSLGGILA